MRDQAQRMVFKVQPDKDETTLEDVTLEPTPAGTLRGQFGGREETSGLGVGRFPKVDTDLTYAQVHRAAVASCKSQVPGKEGKVPYACSFHSFSHLASMRPAPSIGRPRAGAPWRPIYKSH